MTAEGRRDLQELMEGISKLRRASSFHGRITEKLLFENTCPSYIYFVIIEIIPTSAPDLFP